MLRLGSHPAWHPLFETLGYLLGFAAYKKARSSEGDVLDEQQRWSVTAAAAVGALFGSRLLGFFEQAPRLHLALPRLLLPGSGKTIVGGLLGGWVSVELAKKRLGINLRTGDLFALPLCLGIGAGRVGCLLAGLADDTYGMPTTQPWGVDFGDGVARHPTQAYEIVFLCLLAVPLPADHARTKPTVEDQARLQELLAGSFGLKFHQERVVRKAWVLTRGKGPLLLHPAADSQRNPVAAVFEKPDNIFDGFTGGKNASMRLFAHEMSLDLNMPVEDHTGLPGSYDFEVQPFAPQNHDIQVAVRGAMERLGLHIELKDTPVNEFVIDTAVRPPLSPSAPVMHSVQSGPFDPDRDAFQDLAEAKQRATLQHKNILLDVGGNWCGWCLLLDRSMQDDASVRARLDHLIVLHVSTSFYRPNTKFLSRYPPANGYPMWFVLSPKGKLLAAKSPEAFQKTDNTYDTGKIEAYLRQWAGE
nr:prolipoprotein diacylglyceryl transferase family protein [Acidipila sp. EB88]